jgi:hypothetical protein
VRGPEVRGPGLPAQPALDVADARLQQRDVLLERRQVTLENLPPPALVCQRRLDPAQLLRDRVVLLLQPLQPS